MFIAACCLGIILFVAIQLNQTIKSSYFLGIEVWSRWLPVFAIGLIVLMLLGNLSAKGVTHPVLSLAPVIRGPEILIYLILGPILFSSIGNVMATVSAIYCFQKYLLVSGLGDASGIYIFISANLIVALLGDKMPWNTHYHNQTAKKLRELLVGIIAVLALASAMISLIKLKSFSLWLTAFFTFHIHPAIVMGLIAALILAWTGVAMGILRNLSIVVVGIPTTLVCGFLLNLHSFAYLMFFSVLFSLALATAERRRLVCKSQNHKNVRYTYFYS